MASALLAAYGAFAHVTNQTFGHDVVPTGPSLVSIDSDDSQAGAGQVGD